MTVYHWLVVAAIMLAIISKNKRNGRTLYILIMCILMFCVMGLRDCYTIGIDSTTTYLKSFQNIGELSWSEITGKGDRDLNIATSYLFKLIYLISKGDYQWVIIFLAAFEMLALFHFINRYSEAPMQSILCYFGLMFYTFVFSALKQGIAMAIILLSFDAIVDRKPLKFLILVMIAAQFHFPALIFLAAYPISKMKMDRTYFYFLFALFVLAFVFRNQLVRLMTDVYENNIYDSDMRFLANKVIIMIAIIIMGYLLRRPNEKDRIYYISLQLLGIATVLQTFASFNNTFERLADYYFQFSIISIPMIFKHSEGEMTELSSGTVSIIKGVGPFLVCAFAVWRFLNYVDSSAFFSPYSFYFNNSSSEELLNLKYLPYLSIAI